MHMEAMTDAMMSAREDFSLTGKSLSVVNGKPGSMNDNVGPESLEAGAA